MGAVSLLSQLIFMLAYLEHDDSELAEQCATTIRYEQRPDGGWSTTPDGATDVSASVQAYFALKLMGHDPADHRMRKARKRIRGLGGADAADAETRYFLALLGQVSYDACEPMPPEAFFFGRRKSLLQATKSILWSHRPVYPIGIGRGVRELFVARPIKWCTRRSLTRRLPKIVEGHGWTPLRRRATNRIARQLLEHVGQPAAVELTCQELIHHIIALRTLGYELDSPEITQCEESLYDLVDIDETTGSAYPRFTASTVTDSALVLRSLLESGLSPSHPAIREGQDLVSTIATADSSLSSDDIANVIAGVRDREAQRSDCKSFLPPEIDVCWDWRDADFSGDFISDDFHHVNQSEVDSLIVRLTMRQKSSQPHVTGILLESLAATANADAQTAIDRISRSLKSRQRADGSWSDSDGTNQILSTSSAIRGLLAAGSSASDDSIAAAANWLCVEQRRDGSWNHSPAETAWAILSLIPAGKVNEPSVRRGIDYLLNEQNDEGGWSDRQPVFRAPVSNQWFRNDLHSSAWSLMALSRFAVAASSSQSPAGGEMSLRLISSAAEI
jgi:squalene-hopene/tetraprenyl-beta-curcumene cyclase